MQFITRPIEFESARDFRVRLLQARRQFLHIEWTPDTVRMAELFYALGRQDEDTGGALPETSLCNGVSR
jgi:hypothetical protein